MSLICKKNYLSFLFFFLLFSNQPFSETLYFELEEPKTNEEGISINFPNVPMVDLLRCVSEIAQVNFIYTPDIVNFNISLFTGRETTAQNVLSMTLELLESQGIEITSNKENYYLKKKTSSDLSFSQAQKNQEKERSSHFPLFNFEAKFQTYSLEFCSGQEILFAIQQMAKGMREVQDHFPDLFFSIKTMQWLPSTNSLLYSGTDQGIAELTNLICKLDTHAKENQEIQPQHIYEELSKSHPSRLSSPIDREPSTDGNPSFLSERPNKLEKREKKEKKTPFSYPPSYQSPYSSFLQPSAFPFSQNQFQIYKAKYHAGSEICSSIKQMAAGLVGTNHLSKELLESISSMQWVKSTNSILYSGEKDGVWQLTDLIRALDVPRKQVFIEVLVFETKLNNSLNIGLEWASFGNIDDKVRYAVGNLAPHIPKQSSKRASTSSLNQGNISSENFVSLGKGFSLGTIGNVILHKGKSFFSLNALVSALQADGDSTIILNEKVIAQDNQTSTIFSGENIPFFGSTIEINSTSGGSQTTSNIEYRDVGVKLDITPLIGDGEEITLKIGQNITSVVPMALHSSASGIRTAKTDMDAQVHLPDKSFVALSGVMHNQTQKLRTGIPCLGGLPLIGAAFSKNDRASEKRNIMIFVYPQIIHSSENQEAITQKQVKGLQNNCAEPKMIEAAVEWLTEEKRTRHEDSRN